jgi:hypothetical protein
VDSSGQVQNPTLADCAKGISAVKVLALAQQQGQKIYTITPQNAATALPKLPITGALGQEIRSAVQAGKEVTIHEKQITTDGWSGYGYTIIDQDTGAGGYIIEGIGNGGFLGFAFALVLVLIAVIVAFSMIFSGAYLVGLALFAWEALNFHLWIEDIKKAQTEKDFNEANALSALQSLLGFISTGGIIQAIAAKVWGQAMLLAMSLTW